MGTARIHRGEGRTSDPPRVERRSAEALVAAATASGGLRRPVAGGDGQRRAATANGGR